MKKIPTIFKRNPENMRELLNEPHPDCGWVFAGEGVATRKYDGTCVKIENGRYFKRREVKPGKKPPAEFLEEQFDETTGKRVGWVPVDPNSRDDRWHMEAYDPSLPDGTYELIGPKVQGNPEKSETINSFGIPRPKTLTLRGTYDALSKWLQDKDIEAIVFHHPDGKMGKIKKRDFGLK